MPKTKTTALTGSECRAAAAAFSDPGVKQMEVAKKLNLSQAGVYKILKNSKERGTVKRKSYPARIYRANLNEECAS